MHRLASWTLAAILAISAPAVGQTFVYVDADATGSPNDGSDWCHAYLTLHEALSSPPAPGTTICVANGTYVPDPTGLGDPREATFQLISGVTLEGGYAGCGAADPDERHIANYETTLSGDLGASGDSSDNSYHVVTGTNVDPTGALDGFTVLGGNADGAPGVNLGGGMFNDGANANPTVRSCTFRGNSAGNGGHGGGMCNDWGASPNVSHCAFIGNSAAANGGGMYNYLGDPVVVDCTFIGNIAAHGAGMFNQENDPTIMQCAFRENTATTVGGGMLNHAANPNVVECVFQTNDGHTRGGGMLNRLGSAPEILRCTFSFNTAEGGGGVHNDDSSPKFLNCAFSQNMTSFGGGAMRNELGSDPTVVNCVFDGNVAKLGGGMFNLGGSSPQTIGCVFRDNIAEGASESSGGGGAGMINEEDSNPTLVNCTFLGNAATGTGPGGGIFSFNGSPTVLNSIFWENSDADGSGEFAQIQNGGTGTTTVSFSCIDGLDAHAGNGNIGDDPLFVGDSLRLGLGSPCIDAGDTSAVPNGLFVDLDGKGRVVDDVLTDDTGVPATLVSVTVDMGAYEFSLVGDLDRDGDVDFDDLNLLLANYGVPY